MDYSIPIPIKINDKRIYECICKYCCDMVKWKSNNIKNTIIN